MKNIDRFVASEGSGLGLQNHKRNGGDDHRYLLAGMSLGVCKFCLLAVDL